MARVCEWWDPDISFHQINLGDQSGFRTILAVQFGGMVGDLQRNSVLGFSMQSGRLGEHFVGIGG
ncbi:hypothetical protein QJS04_geneDACA005753 [Acorus gramineus]|uniref:Uncharacterized protein n=1 Tax=Acorus gramineus TaxID=55184 RepID=A0AAV9BH22_ACOGR|nr:hypothetical protein QJS04_geneDACA005753 [Acorus gramineus]